MSLKALAEAPRDVLAASALGSCLEARLWNNGGVPLKGLWGIYRGTFKGVIRAHIGAYKDIWGSGFRD